MKNNLFKKSMSVFLATLMLLSCWVFFPGMVPEAEALATIDTYRKADKYGTPYWDGSDVYYSTWNSGSSKTTIKWAKHIYLDISETLQSAGYYYTVDWSYGSGTNYRIINNGFIFGGWGMENPGNWPANYNTMNNMFNNYDLDGSLSNGGFQQTSNNTDGDLFVGVSGLNWSGAKAVIFRSRASTNSEKVFMLGTPKATGTGRYSTSGSKPGNFGGWQEWKKPNIFSGNSWVSASDTYTTSNDSSNWTTDCYETTWKEVAFDITIYDKSTLNSTINEANDIINNYSYRYTTASLNALKTAVNNNKGVLTTRATTQSNIDTANTNIRNAINGLKRVHELTYENLFMISDWAWSASVASSNSSLGAVKPDLSKGTITVNTTGSEVYSSYGSAANHYSIPVKGNTEYRFEANMKLDAGTQGQMFVFFYDANGNGVSGSIYNGATQTAPHIGIYPTSNGEHDITFTTPANCTKVAFRFGATTSGTTATYSDIRFYETARQDIVNAAKAQGINRVVYGAGDYIATSTIPSITRTGYTFSDWLVKDVDNNDDGKWDPITMYVDGAYEMQKNFAIYSDWIPIDVNYENLFSLSDWFKAANGAKSNRGGAITADFDEGTLSIECPSDASSADNNYVPWDYDITIEKNTDYVFEYDADIEAGGMQVHLFLNQGKDVVGNWEAFPNDPYIYAPTTHGKIEFNSADYDNINIRFGTVQNVGVTNTFSNIRLYKKSRQNDLDFGSWLNEYRINTPAKGSDLYTPTRTGYTFNGWYYDEACTSKVGENDVFTKSTTVYAKWTINKYTITWVDGNGKTLKTDTVEHGKTPSYSGETPTKTATAQYSYTFNNKWSPAIEAATKDATYTAQFDSTVNTYTIKFVNEDGTVLQTSKVAYGETPAYEGATPTKAATAQYTYTFKGWDPAIAKVTGDATYTATFTAQKNSYTIKFVNEDGTELQSGEVAYGETPAYTGATPTKAATAQYTYTFAGWTPAITTVTGEATYTATYTATKNSYTIKFVNEDGTELQSGEVAYGETPAYTGATPTKAATAQYTYTFAGWTPEVVAVTDDATYTAKFDSTLKQYTITFDTDGGSAIAPITQNYGTAVTAPADPTKTGYTFDGWDIAVPATMPAENVTVKAKWTINKYTITWVDGNGDTLKTEQVAYGETPAYEGATPTKTATAQYTYTFAGWSPAIEAATKDATYTAQFDSTVNEYTITWVDGNGDTLKTEQVAYGETPAYTGETPTKTATAQYTYTFNNTWSPEIVAVTGEATYTAQFDSTVNEYTITWVDGNGDTLKTEQVAYGETPAYTGETPTKAATDKYTYTFNNTWSPAIAEVTGNATYTAQFDSTVNEYTITWVDGNGDTLKIEQVAYGETPAYTGETPTKAATDKYTYTFNNTWSPAIAEVTGNATYTAQFDSTVNEYTITWVDGDGKTLKTEQVAYGETPAYTGATPTKAATAQYTYTFNNTWSPVIAEVTEDATYTAQFNSTVNEYTITWVDGNGDTLKTEQVAYGETPAYTGETPTKTATAQYTYTFNNTWSPAIAEVTENATYTAQFDSTVNEYTITWVDGNGDTLKTEQVAYGDTPAYTGETPTKAATAQYTYTFNNTWSPVIAEVTEDATYTAQFNSTVNEYTITWKNDDGLVIDTTTVEYGEVPTHADATKAATDKYTYTFNGWTPEVVAVTDDATYTATYTETVNKYIVKFVDEDGTTLIQEYELEYDSVITWPEAPAKESTAENTYTFAGWLDEEDEVIDPTAATAFVKGNATYTAKFDSTLKQYTITFDTDGGTEIAPITQDYGTAITAPADPTKTGYTFDGWDVEIPATMPADDMTITAKWKVNKYTITFNTDGGSAIAPITQDYNTAVTAPADPEKTGYTFDGWDKTIPATMPAENVTVKAQWTINKYTITFDTDGGSAIAPITQDYNTAVTAPADPTKTGYTFAGWDKEIPATMPAENVTVKAQWTINQYTITWVDGNGDTLKTEQVAYGETPAYEGATPTKTATAQYTYTFAGWDPEVVAVTGDATYTATFDSTVNEYTITFVNEDGTVLQTGKVAYGETPAYTGETPTKAATAQYTYTFAGWTPTITEVTGDATYTATFDSTVNEYTITFVNEDGTELQSGKVAYGETPAYTGETPTKAKNAQYTYTFKGWDPAIAEVTGNATYTATYTATVNKYTVKFVNEDGTELQTGKVAYGETPAYTGETPTKAKTAQYTYTFKGWTPEVVAVTGEATYTATFDSTVNEYTITFVNEDGTVLQSGKVAYGETPAYEGATPTKTATAQYTYTFAGWTPEVVAVTGDATYTATYTTTKNSYTITWKNDDGSVIDTTTVEYGVVPTHADATKANTAEYTYTFAGWTPEVVAVTGEATYTATYTATKNSYTITWKNDDGSVIDTTTVEYGVVPTHADATKANTAEYTYTFAGWDPEVVAVTGDATYTATYTATKNSYTITWKNDDGSVIDTTTVEYGEVPTHADATKENTAEYTYAFAGWTPEVVAVTGNAEYTATFTATKNSYTITWKNDDGSVIDTTTVEYGVVPTHADATKANTAEYTYTFAGWDPEVVAVTGDATYTATYTATKNSYTITWKNDDGSVIDTTTVEYGEVPTHADATKEADAQYTYTFTGWSPAIAEVTENATYTAQFDSTVNKYTITWVIDGVETTETYEYGATPTHAVPSKEADAQYTYTFTGWSPAIAEVTEDATYTAQFDSTVNEYTITFVDEDGTVLQSGEVAYGTVPVYTGETPTKESDAQNIYAFNGWTPELAAVTGDATYKATFAATNQSYTVKFVDENGDLLQSSELKFGAIPKYEGVTPTKAATAEYTYTFAGWSPEITTVTGHKTYTAIYTATVNKYTVTWVIDGVETTETYEYGETPIHDDPTKAATVEKHYTFAGWDSEVVAVTGDATYTAQFDEADHSFTYENENAENHKAECDCGYITYVAHTEEEITAKAPTCTQTGLTAGIKCSVCNAVLKEQETVAELGHDWSEWTTTTKATCTEDGEERRDCKACDAYETNVLTQLGHDYEGKVTTEPTCTEKGVKTFTCKNDASHTYTEEVAAKGHTLTAVEAKAPTCTEAGYEAYEYCSACDYTTFAEVAASGHNYVAAETKAPTCTEAGEMTYTCACGDSYTEAIAANGHTLTSVEAKAPTCTEAGYEAYEYCSACDYTTYAEVAATGHIYEASVTAPTCTEGGYTTYTCACGDSYTEEISAKGHTLTSVEAKAPTCTEAGYEAYEYCSACDYTTFAEVAATGHNYVAAETKAPTCTEAGEMTYTCACGDSYTEAIAANGHTLTSVEAKAPTCTEAGYEAYEYCSACDYTTFAEIAASGHDYVAAETKAPTCTEAGEMTYTCACGDSYTEAIAANGHALTSVEAKAPTCTEAGYEAYEYCSACDYTTYAEVAATGHIYEASVTAPTCTEGGYTTYTCACGDTYVTDEVAATGHTEEILEAKAPTCKEDGLTEGKKCSVCGEILVAQQSIPMISEHTWGEWKTESEGDCSTGATYVRTCSVCGKTESKTVQTHTIPTYEDGTPIYSTYAEATCTNAEYYTYYCAVCGKKDRVIVGEALGHKWKLTEKEATCTVDGYTIRECTVCGGTEKDVHKATGHAWVGGTADKAPTCTEDGYENYVYCMNCDAIHYDVVSRTGHKDEDNDGKCDDCLQGMKSAECGCFCHSKNWLMHIIYSIVRFIWKVFGSHQICVCDVAHY